MTGSLSGGAKLREKTMRSRLPSGSDSFSISVG